MIPIPAQPERAAHDAREGGLIAAIVLAAGRSVRYGAQKLVARLGEEPVIRRTVSHVMASAADTVAVVVGADAEAVVGALEGLEVGIVENPSYADGIGTSIAAGVRSLADEVEAVVIVLGDQPTVGAATIDAVIHAYRSGGTTIVVPEFGGIRAPPVLFGRPHFDTLAALTGDRGARQIIESEPTPVSIVAMDGPLPPDIDTPGDLVAIEDDT